MLDPPHTSSCVHVRAKLVVATKRRFDSFLLLLVVLDEFDGLSKQLSLRYSINCLRFDLFIFLEMADSFTLMEGKANSMM